MTDIATGATVDHLDNVLHAVAVVPFADAAHLARLTGAAEPTVEAQLERLVAEGLLVPRNQRGHQLTTAGEERRERTITDRLDEEQWSALERAHERFCDVNESFKELCTRWQVKPGPTLVLNDHADTAYDAEVLASVGVLHDEIQALLQPAVEAVARLQPYTTRFAAAMNRLDGGEIDALLVPLTGSLHDLAMELHCDLLLTLGLARTDRDGD